MTDRSAAAGDVGALLALARRDRRAAAEAIARLSLDAQVALVCEAPVGQRGRLLDLLPEPEAVVPRLPAAELCFTVKALGLESAVWILEHATPEQVVAAVDLDAWSASGIEPRRLDAWLDAIAATDDQAALRSTLALDPELLVHYLRGRVAVEQKPSGDEDWQPPLGAQTLEGQFYFAPLREGDDVAAVVRLLRLLFEHEYWTYFRMLQGVLWELPSENEEWALRWRSGRLQDLGFPSWEEAMQLYNYLSPQQLAALPEATRALDVEAWRLPVWLPELPAAHDAKHLVFRALARLDAEERRAAFYAFVAVANAVAVADGMELGDAETTPAAIDKAALWVSRGLDHVATHNQVAAEEVLRRLPMAALFRVGANLDPRAARPPRRGEGLSGAAPGDEGA